MNFELQLFFKLLCFIGENEKKVELLIEVSKLRNFFILFDFSKKFIEIFIPSRVTTYISTFDDKVVGSNEI
ncbi:hypothetical protein BpHYR1_006727 [Brachionus plicatilis]|uniref:Uncharacterized protein n=1 Tax=Brachionus plicatilis TaxID=10195 RepID=A0A3M7PJB1_BRAPC|nr:hypothetical protein BpHYR1_006727 [Brachionus plicatilis]